MLLFFLSLLPLGVCAQVEERGRVLLANGDSLEGRFRYEEKRLFSGVEYLRDGEENLSLSADTIEELRLEGRTYRSFFIPKGKAGAEGHSLGELLVDGEPMRIHQLRYRYRSCTCQDLPSIREGKLIEKEGDEDPYLVMKNRLLDRIKDPEKIATAFLPFDDLMKEVKDREYSFSRLDEAVKDYNERWKQLGEKQP